MKILEEQKLAHLMQRDKAEDVLGEFRPVGGGLDSTGLRRTMASNDMRIQTKVNQQGKVVPGGVSQNVILSSKTIEPVGFSGSSITDSQTVVFLSILTARGQC